jgi:hypothetical protein
VQGRAHHGAQRGIHPTGVTATGEHRDTRRHPEKLVHPRTLVHGRVPSFSHNCSNS